MLYVSVRKGRAKPTKWKKVLSFSHVVLAVAGLAFMFVSPRGESSGMSNLKPLPGQTLCTQVPAPNLVGLSVAAAEELLTGMGMGWTFFDQDAMMQLHAVPREFPVIQQNPRPGEKTCQVYAVQLIVDLAAAAPMMTTLPSGITTTTTTVKLKATTTTSP
jgi:hypothetical protein